jgi:hypothetical protein
MCEYEKSECEYDGPGVSVSRWSEYEMRFFTHECECEKMSVSASNCNECDSVVLGDSSTISATEDFHSFGAFVNVSPIMKENLRECADSDALAELVWRRLKYRFMYTLVSDSLMFLH